uniref:SIS domain-containing protein n=1 Tax=Astyanax mexicanus TaxID=7994 RepID=A0A8B9H6Q1_ASTMX
TSEVTKYHYKIEEMQHWEQSGYEPSLPITEKSNPITTDIDRADPNGIVQMLEKCDAEMFQKTYKTINLQKLNSCSVIQTMVDISKKVEMILKDPENSLIVLSGCGTSGRVAFLLATSFNRWLAALHENQIYSYIIAGGDKALLTSQEAPEDNPSLGALMLDKVCSGKKHVLFFGISCGLSAPFVAGQLHLCLNNLEVFTPVLVGFNPVNMARTELMRDFPSNFRKIAEKMSEMQKHQRAFVLNPAVGPEAITGSSRMKGGSATKLMLETVLLAGHEAMYNKTLALIEMNEKVHKVTYSKNKKLAALVQKAGVSLRGKGHVYYLGWQTLGIIGIIDASECIPTFGADIRGFICRGFSEINNKEGDLSSEGLHFSISHKDFVKRILPSLSDNDMVIFLFSVHDDLNEVSELAKCVGHNTSNIHALIHDLDGHCVPVSKMTGRYNNVCIVLSTQNQHWELSTKWCLNAISTGAHILKGKVYKNYMIDLRVTNSKLYRRAIGMLQVSTQTQSETALLKSIYYVEELTEEISSADVTQHTLTANQKDQVREH